MANLTIDIIVNDDGTVELKKFSKAADDAEKKTKTLNTSNTKLSGGFKTLAAAIPAAAIAAYAVSVIGLVKSGLASADALAKQSRALGTTAKDLLILNRAAELSGVSQSELEMSLKQVNIRLGQAAMGTGQAGEALKKLGIDLNQLNTMSFSDKIALINKRLDEVVPASQRAAVGMDIFGKNAQKMGLITGKNIETATEEVDKFNIALSAGQLATIEAANDAIGETGTAFKSVTMQLAAEFAPTLKAIANFLSEGAVESGFFKDGIKDFAEFGVSALGVVADAVQVLYTSILGLQTLFYSIKGSLSQINQNEVAASLKKVNNMTDEQFNTARYYDMVLRPYKTRQEAMKALNKELNESITTNNEANIKLAEKIDKLNKLSDGGWASDKLKSMAERNKVEGEIAATEAKIKADKDKAAMLAISNIKVITDEEKNALTDLEEQIYKLTHTDYENQLFDLNKQRDEYQKVIDDKIILDRWYNLEKKNLVGQQIEYEMDAWQAESEAEAATSQEKLNQLQRYYEVTEDYAGIWAFKEAEIRRNNAELTINQIDTILEYEKQAFDKSNDFSDLKLKKIKTVGGAVSFYFEKEATNMMTIAEQTIRALDVITYEMENSFSDFFDYQSDSFLRFGDLAGSVLHEIYKQIMLIAVIRPIVNGIGNALSGASSSDTTVYTPVGNGSHAEGGYTGDGGKYEPAGIVHKGEYVIPAWQVQKNQHLVSALESSRLRGYAEGGSVGAIPNQNIKIEVINQTSEKVSAKTETKIDMNGMVIGIILKAAETNQNGFRESLQGLMR